MTKDIYLAAVEGGGTSFVCSIGKLNLASGEVQIEESIGISSVTSPMDTIHHACSFFQKAKESYPSIDSIGIACFGPLGLDPTSDMFGCILPTTPKQEWAGVNVLTPFREVLGSHIPFRIDTDVNAPAMAEFERFNSTLPKTSPKVASLAYITVGTGVGVGLVINDKPVHGMMHPEGGHVCVTKLEGDDFPGYSWGRKCGTPYNGENTVEGLASSVALVERLTKNNDVLAELGNEENDPRGVLKIIGDDHDIWKHAANAIANLCVTLSLLVSIERIVIGGGIMKRQILIQMIQERCVQLLNGYLGGVQELVDESSPTQFPISTMDDFITTPIYGDQAGLMGAFVLAKQAYLREMKPKQHLPKQELERKEKVKTIAQSSLDLRSFIYGAFVGLGISAISTIRSHKR